MSLDPPKAVTYSEPHPFFWLPIAGQRHAADNRDRDLPYGELIGTLCGRQLKRAQATDVEWLWPTCPDCWTTAAALIGLRA